jgi:hypothetical protein
VIVDSSVGATVVVWVARGPVGDGIRLGVAVRSCGARWITSKPAQ